MCVCAVNAAMGVSLVIATLVTQAVAVAGYHAYLQDVAPGRAGSILGITNTRGVVAGTHTKAKALHPWRCTLHVDVISHAVVLCFCIPRRR